MIQAYWGCLYWKEEDRLGHSPISLRFEAFCSNQISIEQFLDLRLEVCIETGGKYFLRQRCENGAVHDFYPNGDLRSYLGPKMIDTIQL